jgi:hypothetical protein
MLMGLDVVVNPLLDNVPRMTVSTRLAELMPPEFVAELNAWMREFFGVTDQVVLIGDRALAVGPNTLRLMEATYGQPR